jgi:hypothetical protein
LEKTIQLDNNLVKIEFRNFGSKCGLSTRDKMGHLKEAVDNHKNNHASLQYVEAQTQNPYLHLAKDK